MTIFETISTLLESIEHDLRTPLAVLKGDLDRMNMELQNISDTSISDVDQIAIVMTEIKNWASHFSIDRSFRQLDKILAIIPPMQRIKDDVKRDLIRLDLIRNDKQSWFMQYSQLMLKNLYGDYNFKTQIINDTLLEVEFGCNVEDTNHSQHSRLEFSSFIDVFRSRESSIPVNAVMLDAILSRMGWQLLLKINL
jgi:signal transduction histidine kinase